MAYVPTFSSLTDDENSDEKRRLQGEQAPDGSEPSGGSGAPAQGGAAAPAYAQSNFASGRKILQKANAEPFGLEFGQQYADEIGRAGTKLDDDFKKSNDNYTEQLGKYRFGDEDITNAIAGNDSKDLGGFLGSDYSDPKSAPIDYQPFKAEKLSFDPNQFSQLGTSVGLQGELQKTENKSGNYNYTNGQSALDSVIYGGRPEVRNRIKALGDASRDYIARSSNDEKESQDKINGIPGYLSGEQKRVRDILTGKLSGLTEQARTQAPEQYEPLRKSAMDKAKAEAAPDIQKIIDSRAGQLTDPAMSKKYSDMLNDILKNGKNYYSLSGDPSLYYNPDQMHQFNAIENLLGNKDEAINGSLNASFDSKGFTSKADEILKQRMAEQQKIDDRQKILDDQAAAEQSSKGREAEREKNRGPGVVDKSGAAKPSPVPTYYDPSKWVPKGKGNLPHPKGKGTSWKDYV
jgi:hypothetical protein